MGFLAGVFLILFGVEGVFCVACAAVSAISAILFQKFLEICSPM